MLPEWWDAAKNEVVKDKRKGAYNDALRRRLHQAQDVIFKLAEIGELKTLTAAALKKRIEAGENPDPVPAQISCPLVRDLFLQFIDTCKTKGTKTIYRHTLERISKFTNSDTLTFEDIDASWLRKFEAALSENNKVNTIFLHLRNLRAVFNRAIDKETIPQGMYPFRRIKIKKESTPKRSLTIEELGTLRDYPCEE